MEKFCDFITNPEWWSVIATIFAAIAAAVITFVLGRRQNDLQQQQLKLQERQNELQEQQIKLQEQQNELQKQQNSIQTHEMRKMIYNFMHDINGLAAIFLTEIKNFLIEYQTEHNQAPLDDILDEISILSQLPAYSVTDVSIRSLEAYKEQRNQEEANKQALIAKLDNIMQEVNNSCDKYIIK
jgi:mannitol-specific phosphotransferase system IIBC component